MIRLAVLGLRTLEEREIRMSHACFKCGISPPQSALKDRSHGPYEIQERKRGERGTICVRRNGGTEHFSAAATWFTGCREVWWINIYGNQIQKWQTVFSNDILWFPHGAPVKRPAQLLRLLHEISVDLREQGDLIPRKDIWATFARQEEAMRFVKTQAHAKSFSYKDNLSGQRRFLMATYEEFWRRYKNMDSRVRHHYEVIQEGLPCHLYFDLEFNKKGNTNRDVDEMVDILASVTLNTLFEKHHIKGNEEWVIELDSSTEEPQDMYRLLHHYIVFLLQLAMQYYTYKNQDKYVTSKKIIS